MRKVQRFYFLQFGVKSSFLMCCCRVFSLSLSSCIPFFFQNVFPSNSYCALCADWASASIFISFLSSQLLCFFLCVSYCKKSCLTTRLSIFYSVFFLAAFIVFCFNKWLFYANRQTATWKTFFNSFFCYCCFVVHALFLFRPLAVKLPAH